MKKEVADKWIAALRSGEHKQTTFVMKREDPDINAGYCCLGVLQEVVLELPISDKGTTATYLSSEAMAAAEMYLHNGAIRGTDISLSVLNDSGETFEKIADVIEKNWENL